MELEIKNLSKVWITVYLSLIFCYFIISKIPKGLIRLIALLPITTLFTLLPLNLSSFHFCAVTAFFITWLGNSKLLLFAFNQGPLCSPSISLLHFISIASLPIKIKHNSSSQTTQNVKDINYGSYPTPQTTQRGLKSPSNYAIKVLLLAFVIHLYNYEHYMNPIFILVLYCFHTYFCLEIVLAISAVSARIILGFDIEPQFDEPYLSTSLQDFWGRRWNLMATSILRQSVYDPIRCIFTPVIGSKCALSMGVMATFIASGLIHELIYFYLTRVKPTWEVTWFFVLHGVCVVLEIAGKKAVSGRWQLHRWISRPLVIGFMAGTGMWLFFPQIVRNGVVVKANAEFSAAMEFVKYEVLQPLGMGGK